MVSPPLTMRGKYSVLPHSLLNCHAPPTCSPREGLVCGVPQKLLDPHRVPQLEGTRRTILGVKGGFCFIGSLVEGL